MFTMEYCCIVCACVVGVAVYIQLNTRLSPGPAILYRGFFVCGLLTQRCLLSTRHFILSLSGRRADGLQVVYGFKLTADTSHDQAPAQRMSRKRKAVLLSEEK